VLELPKKKESDNKPVELTNNQSENLSNTRSNQTLASPNQVLIVIARDTSAKSVAAMRLIEKGRSLLRVGERDKALSIFEKSLGLEANPHVYFYLSEVHYQLGHYKEALNFLEVAESWLNQQPEWAPQLSALRSEIPGSGFARQELIIG
jgi:tetratricopeptide (TPR) repeat protein